MNETLLLKIALICILLGLPALYIITDYIIISQQVLENAAGYEKEAICRCSAD